MTPPDCSSPSPNSRLALPVLLALFLFFVLPGLRPTSTLPLLAGAIRHKGHRRLRYSHQNTKTDEWNGSGAGSIRLMDEGSRETGENSGDRDSGADKGATVVSRKDRSLMVLMHLLHKEGRERGQLDGGLRAVGVRVVDSARAELGRWLESETHAVYASALTYFGVVTILLVLAVVLVSCCYLHDCLGCYEAAGSKPTGRVFPLPPSGQRAPPRESGAGTRATKHRIHTCGGRRRWSSPVVHL